MKKGMQRFFAILIGVLMIFSTIALFFPVFNTPAPAPVVGTPTFETL